MLKRLLIAFIITLSSSILAQTDLSYVELNTQDMNQLEVQIENLNSAGIRVVHIFPPNAVMVRAGINNQDFANRNANIVNYLPPPQYSGQNRSYLGIPLNETAYKAWLHLTEPDSEKDDSTRKGDPLVNCVLRINDSLRSEIITRGDTALPRTSSPEMFTSNYMIGRIALNIILMESTGDDENWTSYQEDSAIAEIVQGTDFLIQKGAEYDANLS